MDSIYLDGAERVANAGHDIAAAAESMRNTQGYMDESLRMFLIRFEELIERLEATTAAGHPVADADAPEDGSGVFVVTPKREL